jgi:DNA-binding MurR/RpiR family transcriptional regulator
MSSLLTERIDAAYGALAPQERRVAEYLRRTPDAGVLLTSSELAASAGVSKATVSRLFRRLGFTDSREVRSLLRQQRAAGLPVTVPVDDRVGAQLAQDVQNLQEAMPAPDRLEDAAAAIAAAPRVLVLGHRSGYPLGMLLAQALVQARPGVRLAPEAGQALGESLVDLADGDVVLVVDVRRRSEQAARALEAVAAGPASVLLIADPGLPHDVPVRWRFEVPVASPSPFDSYAAAASLISLLAGAVLERLGPDAAARVAAIDRRYREAGELAGPRRSSTSVPPPRSPHSTSSAPVESR